MEETKVQETGGGNAHMPMNPMEGGHHQPNINPKAGGMRHKKKKKRRHKRMGIKNLYPRAVLSPQTKTSRLKISLSESTWDRISYAILDGFENSSRMIPIIGIELISGQASTVPSNVINIPRADSVLKSLSIKEEDTIQLLTFATTITATKNQVENEEQTHTIEKLANVAGHLLASVIDFVIINGRAAVLNTATGTDPDTRHPLIINGVVKLIQGDATLIGSGLINDTEPSHTPIPVAVIDGIQLWGPQILTAVSTALSTLQGNGNASGVLLSYTDRFSCIVNPRVLGNAYSPIPNSLASPADSIKGLMDMGFECTSAIPDGRGLVMSMAGGPVKFLISEPPQIRYLKEDDDGNHVLQCIVKGANRRSRIDNLVVLNFATPP